MRIMINVLKAVSDKNRLRILKMLQKKTMCVCELSAVLSITQPSVSRHLKKLKDAGLIDCRKDGFWTVYFINPSNKFAADISEGIKKQLNDDPQVIEDLEKSNWTDRSKICCSREQKDIT